MILRGHDSTLTLFKLDPHTGVILDLLDHLSTPANDHANRMPRHWHLREEGRVSFCSLLDMKSPPHEQLSTFSGRPALTSMPPPIRDPYSFRSPKPPWSRSRRMSITISQACCKDTEHGAHRKLFCPTVTPASHKPRDHRHKLKTDTQVLSSVTCHPKRQARPAPLFSR